MALEIAEVIASEWLDEASELAHSHWNECERHLQPAGVKVNVEALKALEEVGALLALGVFDDERLVGYCVLILSPHLHYDITTATVDLLFLAEEYRRGRVGLEMIERANALAKERGAEGVTWAAKPDSTLDHILQRLYGEPVDKLYYARV